MASSATASSSSSTMQSNTFASTRNRHGIWAARSVDWPLPSSASATALATGSSGVGGNATSSTSTASTAAAGNITGSAASDAALKAQSSPRCVATANGWIVAVIDQQVIRWNVRRASSHEQVVSLPLPSTTKKSSSSSSSSSHQRIWIDRIFVDPTGCHCLLSGRLLNASGPSPPTAPSSSSGTSAPNTVCYYWHSSWKNHVESLNSSGFDSILSMGYPASQVLNPASLGHPDFPDAPPGSSLQLQLGITPHSYITAVAWDLQRGTEGSTQTILLGTNLGEIYEYSLDSGNTSASTSSGSSSKSTKNTSSSSSNSSSVSSLFFNHHKDPPVLLHRLSSTTTDSETAPITGLYFQRTSNTSAADSSNLMILAATSGWNKRTRLCSFFSHDTSFRTAFAHPSWVELPGSIEGAQLHWSATSGATGSGGPTPTASSSATSTASALMQNSFCLQTQTGIYYGRMDPISQTITDAGILPTEQPPLSIALTPYHFVVLTENQLLFINRVSQTVVQRERIHWWMAGNGDVIDDSDAMESPGSNSMTGELLMDIRRPDQVWFRRGRTLVHISSSSENRDVWRFWLEKAINTSNLEAANKLFDEAKSLCSIAAQKAVVTYMRAEYYLAHDHPEMAAPYLAQSPPQLAPFADTCLRLGLPRLSISSGDAFSMATGTTSKKNKTSTLKTTNKPLMAYLSDKLSRKQHDSVYQTMLSAWLTELSLHEGVVPLLPSKPSSSSSFTGTGSFLGIGGGVDPKTLLRIFTSHDVPEYADYAMASGDLGVALQAALAHKTHTETTALRLLNEASLEIAEPYYYYHAFTLLCRAPLAASKSFLSRYSQGLSPTKLLPSIMHYEKQRNEHKLSQIPSTTAPTTTLDSLQLGGSKSFEVEIHMVRSFVNDETASIKYLEGVIKLGCKASAIYSYLISLYVAMEDEEPLLKFLKTHIPAAAKALDTSNGGSHPLDMSFALRTILSSGRHFRSAIQLYMGFGMREQAVELALKVDPTLARELARSSQLEQEQKQQQNDESSEDAAAASSAAREETKRLWLMIARTAASSTEQRHGKDVVGKVVSVLQDCGPDILSIEDVLPFLPDFCQIDQIKDQICEALTSYSSKIEYLQKEMKECDDACDTLRTEMNRLGNHRMQMKADAQCAVTGKLVLNAGEPFYVFPSGYVFTESALVKLVTPNLNQEQRSRVKELSNLLGQQQEESKNASATSPRNFTKLQSEYDGLIAAECPYTGSMMVNSIDCGFPESMEADEAFFTLGQTSQAQKPSPDIEQVPSTSSGGGLTPK